MGGDAARAGIDAAKLWYDEGGGREKVTGIAVEAATAAGDAAKKEAQRQADELWKWLQGIGGGGGALAAVGAFMARKKPA